LVKEKQKTPPNFVSFDGAKLLLFTHLTKNKQGQLVPYNLLILCLLTFL